jgi:hypothetical protein
MERLEVRMIIKQYALAFFSCAHLFVAFDVSAITLDEWIGQNVQGDEQVICKKELNGEYFFVARAGSKVKVGNRLDVTGDSKPQSIAVAWMFQNSAGKSLSSKARPIAVRSDYKREGTRIFADNVDYQVLKLEGQTTVRAAVVVRKCAVAQCTVERETLQEPKYIIRLCEFPM